MNIQFVFQTTLSMGLLLQKLTELVVLAMDACLGLTKTFNFTFVNVSNNTISSAKIKEKMFYFIPLYINCTNWKEEMDSFEEYLNNLCPENFCLIGDFNARVGEE